jgi:hypothetical protein
MVVMVCKMHEGRTCAQAQICSCGDPVGKGSAQQLLPRQPYLSWAGRFWGKGDSDEMTPGQQVE